MIINTQEMSGALAEYLTTDIQMKLYRGTVLTVLEKCNGETGYRYAGNVTMIICMHATSYTYSCIPHSKLCDY